MAKKGERDPKRERFWRERALGEERSPQVCTAAHEDQATLGLDGDAVVPVVRIGLEITVIAPQPPRRAIAAVREGEVVYTVAVLRVAAIGSEVARFGLRFPGNDHRHPRIIGIDLAGPQDLGGHQGHEDRQRARHLPQPAALRRAGNQPAVTVADLFLPIGR
jgi:hypothetical protein